MNLYKRAIGASVQVDGDGDHYIVEIKRTGDGRARVVRRVDGKRVTFYLGKARYTDDGLVVAKRGDWPADVLAELERALAREAKVAKMHVAPQFLELFRL